jgi:hypothetical protein
MEPRSPADAGVASEVLQVCFSCVRGLCMSVCLSVCLPASLSVCARAGGVRVCVCLHPCVLTRACRVCARVLYVHG